MKSLILLINVFFLGVLVSHAQNKVDNTINKANNSLNSVNNSTTNAAATATNAATTITTTASTVKDVGNKFGSLFGKKKAAATNVTKITVVGGTLGKVKAICNSIKTCACVDAANTNYSFADDDQSITVTHSGSTSDLLEDIEKKTTLVTDDNTSNVGTGKMTVKLQ